MRCSLILAGLAGLLLDPIASRMADAICAPRVIPDWMYLLPYVVIGLFIGLVITSARRRRRAGSPFVLMRGRVQCPDCAYLLDLDDRHCARCGAAIVQVKKREQCARCRARNWEDDGFCRQCGVALERPDAATE